MVGLMLFIFFLICTILSLSYLILNQDVKHDCNIFNFLCLYMMTLVESVIPKSMFLFPAYAKLQSL